MSKCPLTTAGEVGKQAAYTSLRWRLLLLFTLDSMDVMNVSLHSPCTFLICLTYVLLLAAHSIDPIESASWPYVGDPASQFVEKNSLNSNSPFLEPHSVTIYFNPRKLSGLNGTILFSNFF